MIERVSANQSSFREIRFSPGFNLVLAERTTDATDRDSRNGLGKSLLVEILHYCLGARGSSGHGVVVDALDDWQFRLDINLDGSRIGLTRSVAADQRRWTYVDSSGITWPIEPDAPENRPRFTAPALNQVLGRMMFGLTADIEGAKWGPTYRSLVSYLIRHGSGAFLDPFTHYPRQQEWDKQVNVAYHLGLNWQDAAALQQLRSDKNVIDNLARATKSGSLPSYLGTEGALEAERVRLEASIERRVQRLEEFRVVEDYSAIEAEADSLTEKIHDLVNANIRDRRYRELYSSRLDEERGQAISPAEVESLFEEANVVFPEQVSRRLQEVKDFHSAVVSNRRAYLANEIERLDGAITDRDGEISGLDERKSELMRVLESAGALEEYTRLQEMLVELRGQLHDVNARLQRLKEAADAKQEWARRKGEAVRGARIRYDELLAERDRAITYFNSNTEALYEAPGRLIIDVSEKGIEYKVEIDRSDSHGVSNMKIFCFDLMLMQLWCHRGTGPRMLVHDSALFDGVDERQVAAALDLAYREADRLGFQYICTMNSDDLPVAELGEGHPVLGDPAIRLTDDDPSGMLLGIKF